jgi:hypothetical protein
VSTSALSLIPLTQFRQELEFFSPTFDNQLRCGIDQDGKFTPNDEEPFEICLVEESDLPEVSLFIVKAFGADAISLSSNEFSAFEKGMMAPALDFFNGYAAVTAFAEVLWGLRIRQADRVLRAKNVIDDSPVVNDISGPVLNGKTYEEKLAVANRKSLVLVMARPSANNESNSSKWESIDSNIDVIAAVELRLQVCRPRQICGESMHSPVLTHHHHIANCSFSRVTPKFPFPFHGGMVLSVELQHSSAFPRTRTPSIFSPT